MHRIPATFASMLIATCIFSQTTLHNFHARTILGDDLDFSSFYGKKVMVVNTASYCGWTYQYETLEDLYEQYKDSSFEIVGFPCNDFSNQEPGSDSSINEFCTDIYGITFQMMSKVSVISPDTADIYKWLQRQDLNGVADAHVSWNFNKFLIDEAGHWVRHLTNLTEPFDTAIINWILSPSVLPSDTISDTTSTGISETSLQIQIESAQPGSLRISFRNVGKHSVEATLLTLDGQQLNSLYRGMLYDNEPLLIDTRTLAPGIYLLQVISVGESKVFKLSIGY